MFTLMAVVGAGNPAVDAAMLKVNAEYPTLGGNSTAFEYCINWIFDFWCFDDVSLDWFNLAPAYVNTTFVRAEGMNEVIREVVQPQNFTVLGSDVAMDTIPYVYVFLTVIAGIGSFFKLAELIPG